MQILETRSEVKVTVKQGWFVTLQHPKMRPHTKFGIPTSNNLRDMLQTGLSTRADVKVTWTHKWYATLRHPKMHLRAKFGIPTSKNIGDMHRTRSETDWQCDYYMPPWVPLGHKNNCRRKRIKNVMQKYMDFYVCGIGQKDLTKVYQNPTEIVKIAKLMLP